MSKWKQDTDRDLTKYVAAELRYERRASRWTQAEMAVVTGISVRTLARIEKGSTSPTVWQLENLCGWYETAVPLLLQRAENWRNSGCGVI